MKGVSFNSSLYAIKREGGKSRYVNCASSVSDCVALNSNTNFRFVLLHKKRCLKCLFKV